MRLKTSLDVLFSEVEHFDSSGDFGSLGRQAELSMENLFDLDDEDRRNPVSKMNKVKAFISSPGKEALLELLRDSAYIFHAMVSHSVRPEIINIYAFCLSQGERGENRTGG